MSEEQHAADQGGDVEDIATGQVDEDIKNGDQKKGKLVTVTVDTKPHTVRKGRYIVTDFKRLVGVDPNYQLDEVVNGQFVERKDTEKVSIRGKEVFVSHVRGGAAS
ncbi:MAG: hypothetical protein Q8O42_17310 [Acidobacteriota bacterium]|nr:hypothetical protein [Acidobacteriota bacterium]